MLLIRLNTWWDAVLAGVMAGVVGGLIWGSLNSIGSSHSVWWEVGHTVPPAMAGGIVFCLILRHNRQERQQPSA